MKCQVVKVQTPKGILLDGLWFGSEKPKHTIIYIHGLGSDLFSSGMRLAAPLVDNSTSVLLFSNRGFGGLNRVGKLDKRKKSGRTYIKGGFANEVFTDCVDDIQGSIDFAISMGSRSVTLVGQSTGCQKIVYYAAKSNKQKAIRSIVLLSPISDYAGIKKINKQKYETALSEAEHLVKEGKPHELLSPEIWSYPIDAQRFLSLYTPDSEEEIFCYSQKNKRPTTLQKIKVPIVVVLGEKDEYRDRPIKSIAKWFEKALKKQKSNTIIIPNAGHSFVGNEEQILGIIKKQTS